MTRRVLFDVDYCSSPVWDADRAGFNLPLEHLPISAQLRAELRAWADEWTENEMAIVVREDRAPDDAADRERWVRGAALCERLRAELGEGWRVGRRRYFDGEQHVQWAADGPWKPWSPTPWRRPDEGLTSGARADGLDSGS